jgi:hypothetical protein
VLENWHGGAQRTSTRHLRPWRRLVVDGGPRARALGHGPRPLDLVVYSKIS